MAKSDLTPRRGAKSRRAWASVFCLLACTTFALPAIAAPHPALWHVQTRGGGEAWLLGAVHVLPPKLQWRTPEIARATDRADVFVFEVPNDAAAQMQLQSLVAAHGALPPGQSLRALLPPAAQADYDDALAQAHLTLERVDHERPWLVSLQLLVAETLDKNLSAEAGTDHVVMAGAEAAHKELRYLETIDQQFALLAPDDDTVELQEFQSDLKSLKTASKELGPMVDAWARGDTRALDRLMNGELAAYPEARKALITDRNARWVLQIGAMLKEKHRFFITVGAGHLVGPEGVPALLRKAGYAVTGT